MLEIERTDIPQKIPGGYGGLYRRYNRFAHCRVEDGILRVALFFPDHLRTGDRQPSYEVFIDRAARKFITYDRMADKVGIPQNYILPLQIPGGEKRLPPLADASAAGAVSALIMGKRDDRLSVRTGHSYRSILGFCRRAN